MNEGLGDHEEQGTRPCGRWKNPVTRRLNSSDPILAKTLAEKRGPIAIGIILSGCGSDGAKGIQAIKRVGGITFAQDAKSDLFFGMQNAAIQTGDVDFVLAPGKIAQALVRISRGGDPKDLEKADVHTKTV
jgi:chemotaxis response regulator CheB